MALLFCLVLGAVAGLSSGIFGIGGGIIIVPALIAAFGFTQQKANGTSLASLLAPVGIFAVLNYHKSGNIDLRYAGCIALGYLGAAYSGSKFAISVSSEALSRGFGILLIVVGLLMVTGKMG